MDEKTIIVIEGKTASKIRRKVKWSDSLILLTVKNLRTAFLGAPKRLIRLKRSDVLPSDES